MAKEIERYLGRLENQIEGKVDPQRAQEFLTEVENHLYESATAHEELGCDTALAARLSIQALGEPKEFTSNWLKEQPKNHHKELLQTFCKRASQTAVATISAALVLFSYVISNAALAFTVVLGFAAILALSTALAPVSLARSTAKAWLTSILLVSLSSFLLFRGTHNPTTGDLLGLKIGKSYMFQDGIETPGKADSLDVLFTETENRFLGDYSAILNQQPFNPDHEGLYSAPYLTDSSTHYRLTESPKDALLAWNIYGPEFQARTIKSVESRSFRNRTKAAVVNATMTESIAPVARSLAGPILGSAILALLATLIGTGIKALINIPKWRKTTR